jgi:hypothetical protein
MQASVHVVASHVAGQQVGSVYGQGPASVYTAAGALGARVREIAKEVGDAQARAQRLGFRVSMSVVVSNDWSLVTRVRPLEGFLV